MPGWLVSLVVWAIEYFLQKEVIQNHPVIKKILNPVPLNPDPNPPLSQRDNPNEANHYGG
jgi:hypothetical protein